MNWYGTGRPHDQRFDGTEAKLSLKNAARSLLNFGPPKFLARIVEPMFSLCC